jgi:hypothetical protein
VAAVHTFRTGEAVGQDAAPEVGPEAALYVGRWTEPHGIGLSGLVRFSGILKRNPPAFRKFQCSSLHKRGSRTIGGFVGGLEQRGFADYRSADALPIWIHPLTP